MDYELLTMDATQVSKATTRLIKNMGVSLFWDFLDFIIDIKKSDYNIKILKARRFYVLYHVFDDIINCLYKKSVITVGKIVSNYALPAIKDELKDAKILLVDDVLLHGRAMEDVYNYLINECHCDKDRIDLKVYLRNEDRNLVFRKKNIVSKQSVHDQNWAWMSCSFVDTFLIAGRPYISILPYFKISAARKEVADKIHMIIDHSSSATTDVQKYNGGKLWIYMKDSSTQYFEQVFIRIYECADESEYLFVPYMFLKPMSKDIIINLIKDLLSYDVLDFVSPSFLKSGFNNLAEKDYIYLYNILTYIGSKTIGMEMIDSIEGQQYVKWDDSVEKDGIYCNVNIRKDMTPLIMNIFKGTNVVAEDYPQNIEETDVDEIVEKASQKNDQSIRYFLDMYLSYSGKKDKELADNDQNRMNGLRFSRLMKHLDYEKNKKKFWCEIVKAIDLGKGTIIASKSKSGFYENLLFAGEQCFTCGEEYKMAIGFSQIAFKDFCNHISTSVISDGKKQELCDKLFNDIVCIDRNIKNNIPDEELDYLIKEDTLERYKNYYLLRYPVYQNSPMMQRVSGIVSKYEEQILEGTLL